MRTTDQHEGMVAETTALQGHAGEFIHAYFARPTGPGPFPGMVLFHHRPGWDEWYKEITRRFAHHGYATICPDLYCRTAHGEPDDVAARVGAEGGVADEQVLGDSDACVQFLRALPILNGKVGLMGTCSGGRHAFLAASRGERVDAVVDCWGGGVVMELDDLTEERPVAPIDYTKDLQCPLLGLFGEEDQSPSPEQVAQHEAELRRHGKDYEFHMYPDAGHGFFYHDRPAAYRTAQAVDGWGKVWDFLSRHLT